MELANMLLNQLTKSDLSSELSINKKQSVINQDFTKFFNNAKSSVNNKMDNNKSNYEVQKNYKFLKKKDNTYNESGNNIKEDNKTYNENNIDLKDDVKVEEKDDVVEDKNSNKIIIFDNNILNQLSEALKMPSEDVMVILSTLNISVSMLEEPENLINFLQEAFNLEEPVQLLSKDRIRDLMSEVTDIAKFIDYTDIASSFEEVQNIIENSDLQNIKLVNLEDNFENTVENLLTKLNGSVSEVKKVNNLEEISVTEQEFILDVDITKVNDGLEKHSQQNNSFNQNQSNNNFNSGANIDVKTDVKIELFNISEITESTNVFNATLPKTQSLKNINSTEVISQILEKMKTSVKADMTEIKILLRPEHLGEVSLKIATHNGFVTAQFTAESQKVKEIIESNFNQLKDMLNEQGINVGALEVNVSDKGQEQETFKQFENMQEKSSKRMEEIVSKSFDEETEQEEKVKLDNSQIDYAI